VLVIGRLPDRQVALCRLKDRPRRHIAPFRGPLRDPGEEGSFARRESRDAGIKPRCHDRPGRGGDVGVGDPPAAVLLGPEDCRPDEVDPDPDVLLAGGDHCDAVEERRREHPGVEPLPDAVGEDLADLGPRVGRKVDLGRVEDRPDARVGLGVEVPGKIARDRKDPGLPDVPLLVEPEDLVEDGVVDPGHYEFIGVVEADDEGGVAVPEPGGDPLLDLVEVPAGGIPADLPKDAPVDGERRMIVAAVDVDRGDPPGLFGDGGKDPADGGGLPGPGESAEDGGEGAPAPEGRLEEEGDLLDLGVAVVEVLGDEREFKDVGISEEGLVVAEKPGMRHTSISRRGD